MLNRKYDYLHTRLMLDNRTVMIGKNRQVLTYFRRSVSVLLLGSGLEDVAFACRKKQKIVWFSRTSGKTLGSTQLNI